VCGAIFKVSVQVIQIPVIRSLRRALQVFLLPFASEGGVRWRGARRLLGAAVQDHEPLVAQGEKEHSVLGLASVTEPENKRSLPTISDVRHTKLNPERAQDIQSAGSATRLTGRKAVEPIRHRRAAV
jgi:hypothetical protein